MHQSHAERQDQQWWTATLPEISLKKLFQLFQLQEKKSSPIDPLEITTDQERRQVFLR